MWEFLRSMIVSRGGQLAARYAAKGVMFLAGYLSLNLDSGHVEVTGQVLGSLLLAGVLALADLIIHKILKTEPGTSAPPTAGPPLPRITAFLLLALFLPCLAGCWGSKEPDSVVQARSQKRKAMLAYSDGNDLVVDAILDAYRQEAWARIDLGMQKDIETAKANAAGAGGKVDIGQALAFAQKLMQERDDAKLKVEQTIGKIREVMAANKVNLAITMKLDDAISAYESAGFDMSAARQAADDIMALVTQTMKGKKP